MITLKEILKDKDYNKLDKEIQDNLTILLEKINKIRALFGKPMTVSSGLRTKEDQIRVYKEKATKAGTAFDESKVPMGSQHLHGAALDIYDPKKELQKWCLDNENKLEEIGLWMENFTATPNWCHFQIYPPKSGKRFFNP
jgi:uncharacterized protein YcbK (DUF882 family)